MSKAFYNNNNPVIKTKYYMIRVISSEAELFVIRCGMNQATHLPNVNWIIVITDLIYTTKKIFDSLAHPINYNLWQSLKISESFSRKVTAILLNFGIFQVVNSSIFII